MTPPDDELPDALRPLLARHHFDRVPFARLRAPVREGADLDALHAITRPVAPPPLDCAAEIPAEGGEAWRRLRDEGEAAIARGELAAVVLAGGMATRFGSVVKALAPLAEGSKVRFIDARLADVDRYHGKVDLTLMTSFATDTAIRDSLAREGRADVHVATQFVSLRLAPDGSLFRDDLGAPSPYATGHGDLPDALLAAGAIDRLRAKGVRTLLMSNVDNVGATVDPVLFAMHLASKARVSVELVSKVKGDRGGLPVSVDGRLVLAETFRLPKGFPDQDFPLFNTNTLWIDLDALDGEHPWTWCYARKKVDGREAVQVERLVGELTWWNPTAYVHVPRAGAASRFLPVKDLAELEGRRDEIASVLSARLGLRL
ncbi:MAG: UTP--glucose-1-phosphate uridylyltransferase [Polyangiales bacterium]